MRCTTPHRVVQQLTKRHSVVNSSCLYSHHCFTQQQAAAQHLHSHRRWSSSVSTTSSPCLTSSCSPVHTHAQTQRILLRSPPAPVTSLSIDPTHTSSDVPPINVHHPEMSPFMGAAAAFTEKLELTLPDQYSAIPCFRLTNAAGQLMTDYTVPHSDATLLKMYSTMVYTHVMDGIFYDAQRQGRISFYMTNYGEEASHVGSVAALKSDDVIFGQYREAGVFIWRGYNIQQVAHQCFSNTHDLGKGKQMPVHYGSKDLHIQTISSPLGTQLPQAAGAAYALKREGKGRIVMCYFGEGAASEGDFHPALNFSATLCCPVLFFCRNNNYAISTPAAEQYRGDGIAGRAHGYGMACIRVDGNDLLAVYEATRYAREYAATHNSPVLIEAMTYRGGHHSTSDDSTRYRSSEEINYWASTQNPLTRFRLFLEKRHLWDSDQEVALRKTAKREVIQAMKAAEQSKKPPISQLFEDVYDTLPKHLRQQAAELQQHLQKYGEHYQLGSFDKEEDYQQPTLVPMPPLQNPQDKGR